MLFSQNVVSQKPIIFANINRAEPNVSATYHIRLAYKKWRCLKSQYKSLYRNEGMTDKGKNVLPRQLCCWAIRKEERCMD